MNDVNDSQTEVQELVWALVDEQATEKEVRRLERLLLDSDEARRTYVLCMQMHADLHFLLSGKRPQLPTAIETVKKAKMAKTAKTPLPLVDLPPAGSDVPLSNGFAS